MSESINISISDVIEDITINVSCTASDNVDINTSETIENVSVNIDDTIYDVSTQWINLATGFNIEPILQTTTLLGEVYEYAYLGGKTYYRYIATDGSIDAFYDSYTAPATLGNLIVKKRIVI